MGHYDGVYPLEDSFVGGGMAHWGCNSLRSGIVKRGRGDLSKQAFKSLCKEARRRQ